MCYLRGVTDFPQTCLIWQMPISGEIDLFQAEGNDNGGGIAGGDFGADGGRSSAPDSLWRSRTFTLEAKSMDAR